MTTHEIEAGDWLGAVAEIYGFEHWSRIWDAPSNASLRERRPSPDMLMIGDEVHVPEDDAERAVEVGTGHRAVFVLRKEDVLRLRICGLGGFISAFGAVPFKLEVGSQVLEGELEHDGQELCVPLEASARQAKLTLSGDLVHEFAVGGLGPAGEERGAHARLVNLGFRDDFISGGESGDAGQEPERDPVETAIAAFQARCGLCRTAKLDEPTAAEIRARYEG